MATSKLKLTELESLGEAAECLRTLAHPHRLRMIQMLLHRHLRHGHDSGSHAVESVGQVTDCTASEELLNNIEPIVLQLES